MKRYEKVITDEDVERAKTEGINCLFSDNLLYGYGVYGAHIVEKDGKHILVYELGDSCD